MSGDEAPHQGRGSQSVVCADGAERGSAVADFVLVSALVTVLFAAILQIGFVLHVRNTLLWCASEGARQGARAGNSTSDGAARTRGLVRDALTDGYAQEVTARRVVHDGVTVVEVSITAPLPVVALVGPSGAMSVVGRAFAEEQ